MVRVNLLPWRETRREERQRNFIGAMVGAVVFAVLVVVLLHVVIATLIDYQRMRNHLLQKEITVLDNKISQIKSLKQTKKALLARMQIIEQLQMNRPQVVHLFDEIMQIIPEGMHFTEISRKGDVVTLRGFANSNTNVSSLMRRIDNSKWCGFPVLKEIKTDKAGLATTNQFSLDMYVTNPQQQTPPWKRRESSATGKGQHG